jgi:hypothetical protein
MQEPKGWLQTCHPVAVHVGEAIATLNGLVNVFKEEGYLLEGDPSRYAPYKPMRIEEVASPSSFQLLFPDEEKIASLPQTREKVIPGQNVSYMVTIRGKMDEAGWKTLKDRSNVEYGDKRQYLSRFYVYNPDENGETIYNFFLQMMLTQKEYTRLLPVKTKAVIAYLQELAPELELKTEHVFDEHVRYDVLNDTQFMLGGETWYSYHPLYIAPGKDTIVDAFKKDGATEWSPLAYIRGKRSGFASFPREIHSCDEDVVKPPFEPESFRAFEDAEIERVIQVKRQEFYRKEFARRVVVNVTYTTIDGFMDALIKRYENKIKNKLKLSAILGIAGALREGTPNAIASNLLRVYSNLESTTKKKISFYKLLYEYPSNPEEFTKRFAPKIPNDEGEQEQFIEVTKDFLKACYQRARTAMARIDFDKFPYRVMYTNQVLDEVENDFIIRDAKNVESTNIAITIELDLTSLLDTAPPVYIPNLQRLRRELLPEQTAKGQAEKARRDWEEVHELHPLRGAGVSPVPNPGYWMAAVRRRQEALCGAFAWS